MRPFLVLGYCSHGFRYRLQSRDTTQDTRPVCGLLQGQGVRLESIRSPSLRQINEEAAHWAAFLFGWREARQVLPN